MPVYSQVTSVWPDSSACRDELDPLMSDRSTTSAPAAVNAISAMYARMMFSVKSFDPTVTFRPCSDGIGWIEPGWMS